MNNIGTLIFNFLVFPGFVFVSIVGMIASFVDRKVTARVQWRKGPPLFQPLYDIVKLFGKETLIPTGVPKLLFLSLPFIALTSLLLISIIPGVIVNGNPVIGDLIVVVYLMMVPTLCLILAGSISGNPLGSLGASREMKLALAYEVPFILSLLVPVIHSGGSITVTGIAQAQVANRPVVFTLSGILAVISAILCLQAKLGLVPFDVAEAEQEITGGLLIEYSGLPLAMFKLTKIIMLFVYPMLLVKLFWFSRTGNVGLDVINTALKYVLFLVLVILIRNTNPRVRIDQAVRFFWTYGSVIALISVLLAITGY